jgi:cytochrome P450
MTDQSLSALRRRFSGWNEGRDDTLAGVFFDTSVDRWVVTSHAAALETFQTRNPGLPGTRGQGCPVGAASDIQAVLNRGEYLFSLGMMFQRSPDSERLRKTTMRHLGAKEMLTMESQLGESAGLLLSAALERGSLEVFGDFARPLVDGSLLGMLGLPRDQWVALAKLSTAVSFLFGLGVTASERAAGIFAFAELTRIVRRLLSDVNRPWTLAMADWAEAIRLGTWSAEEAEAQIAMLIVAGRVTPITAIGSMVYHLALHPSAWTAARSGSLTIDAVIDECLRLGPPKAIVPKTLWEGGTIGGVEIPPGERLLLMVGRANRDPEVFSDPLEFNPWRCPMRNLAFGAGSRRCPGMHLARAQLRAALTALLKYLPEPEIIGEPRWIEALHNERVLDRLEIRIRQARA